MSLLVWMPFNGNLNNQGTGQVTVKSGTPSYVNGLTYRANQNATLVMSCPELKGVSIFTWCFFGKIVKTTVDWADMAWLATCKTDFTDDSRIRFEGYTSSPKISWYGNNDYYIAKGSAPDLGVSDQIFHHFALVADGSHVYTYVDGDLKSTYEQHPELKTLVDQDTLISMIEKIIDDNMDEMNKVIHNIDPEETAKKLAESDDTNTPKTTETEDKK